ncbi:MAG: hypothetical protein D6753_17525 [Planctomycetota bacterium]|nr:MAG: hypothetical protein D6753_17525 [Planctomycetota bacterium]
MRLGIEHGRIDATHSVEDRKKGGTITAQRKLDAMAGLEYCNSPTMPRVSESDPDGQRQIPTIS